jgi:hypothetical protein
VLDESSPNPQISRIARPFISDETHPVAVLLHQLAVAGEDLFTRLQRAAEIAARPRPRASHCSAEGAAADVA